MVRSSAGLVIIWVRGTGASPPLDVPSGGVIGEMLPHRVLPVASVWLTQREAGSGDLRPEGGGTGPPAHPLSVSVGIHSSRPEVQVVPLFHGGQGWDPTLPPALPGGVCYGGPMSLSRAVFP